MKTTIKCLAIALAAYCFSAVALADNGLPTQGFYIGLDAGVTHSTVRLDNSFRLDDETLFGAINPIDVMNDIELHRAGFLGGIFAGYFFTHEKLTGALEISADLARRRITDNDVVGFSALSGVVSFSHNVRTRLRNFEINADLKPGILITPSADLYGIIGIAFNRTKITHSNFLLIDDVESPLITNTDGTKTKNKVALRLGIGLQEKIYENWSTRLQYVFTDYGTLVSPVVISEGEIVGPLNFSTASRTKFKTWTATLGMTYNFPV